MQSFRRPSLAVLGSLGIALAAGLGGCVHPIHMGGEYYAHSAPVNRSDRETLIETDRMVLFWGLFDDGEPDIQQDLESVLGTSAVLRDLTVDISTSPLGVLLGFLTWGIVSQDQIVIEGRRVNVAPPTGPARDLPQRAGPY